VSSVLKDLIDWLVDPWLKKCCICISVILHLYACNGVNACHTHVPTLTPHFYTHIFTHTHSHTRIHTHTSTCTCNIMLQHRYQEELHKDPDTLDALKHVLNTVATIRSEGMTMELKYSDLEERFRTRVMYAQPQDLDHANEQLVLAQQVCMQYAIQVVPASVLGHSEHKTVHFS